MLKNEISLSSPNLAALPPMACYSSCQSLEMKQDETRQGLLWSFAFKTVRLHMFKSKLSSFYAGTVTCAPASLLSHLVEETGANFEL